MEENPTPVEVGNGWYLVDPIDSHGFSRTHQRCLDRAGLGTTGLAALATPWPHGGACDRVL